jgi:hypothetical protein
MSWSYPYKAGPEELEAALAQMRAALESDCTPMNLYYYPHDGHARHSEFGVALHINSMVYKIHATHPDKMTFAQAVEVLTEQAKALGLKDLSRLAQNAGLSKWSFLWRADTQ